MWDSIWINGSLTCLNKPNKYSIISNGAIAVENQEIVWVGSLHEMKVAPEKIAKQVHDLKGKWLMPGLIDCHTHLIYGGQRSDEFKHLLDGKSYEEILTSGGGIYSTVHATREISHDKLFSLSAKRLNLWINQGITTIEIKSGYGLSLESEYKILRIAKDLENHFPITIKKTFLGAHTISPEFKNNPSGYIDYVCNEVLPFLHKDNLVDAVDAFCEIIAFDANQIKILFEKAKSLNLPIKIHAEQLSNCGGVSLASKYCALSADHLEFATESDVQSMAKAGVTAVLLPSAFYFLRSKQKPPVNLLRQYGVPIAIATDHNPGTSPNTSILLAMNMACVLFRLTPCEALHGVTINAAKALGLQDTHGSLEVGKVADFSIWDIEHPTQLSYYFGNNSCTGIVKNGTSISFTQENYATPK